MIYSTSAAKTSKHLLFIYSETYTYVLRVEFIFAPYPLWGDVGRGLLEDQSTHFTPRRPASAVQERIDGFCRPPAVPHVLLYMLYVEDRVYREAHQ